MLVSSLVIFSSCSNYESKQIWCILFSLQNPQPVNTTAEQQQLPAAAIVCIAIGAYLVLIVIALIIRQILLVSWYHINNLSQLILIYAT